jgi:colanic acid/amylovoran biosynthesis glycosyltransferase
MQDRKLHICIVTGEFPALTETFITTKVLELHKRGHRVTVIKNEDTNHVNTSHVALIKKANIEVLSFINISSVSKLIKAAAKNPSLLLQSLSPKPSVFKRKYKQALQRKLLQKYAFDVVHFEFSGLAVSYLDTIKGLGNKTVVSCRGTAEKVKPLSQPQRKAQLESLFAAVSAIHCVSQDMANTIQSYCNNYSKIFINRPSIDPDVFKRAKLYTNSDTSLQILTVGRFTFQKGYVVGLMAMKELRLKGIDFTWNIVGDGPQHEELIYHIHALQLQDCVKLLGKKNRDEILDLYNKVDVFLLTSVYEGIANVCLEAMSMELPVVSTKSGGMEEVIEHGKDGLLCEVYNAKDIAEKLNLIANDYETRKQLGIQARKKVLQDFTLQRQVNVFEEQYYRLINN